MDYSGYSYDKAAYCLEELVLANPHHHLYHQRYAEVSKLHIARYWYGTLSQLSVQLTRTSVLMSLALRVQYPRSVSVWWALFFCYSFYILLGAFPFLDCVYMYIIDGIPLHRCVTHRVQWTASRWPENTLPLRLSWIQTTCEHCMASAW